MTALRNPGADKKPEQSPPTRTDAVNWIDHFVVIFNRFSRFGWDLLGIVLLVLALLLLLALSGLTRGAWITPLIDLLQRWLGWGSFILAISIGMVGLLAVRWQAAHALSIRLSRILCLEGAAFSFLAVLSLIGGASLDVAEKGNDPGGIIGWSLAALLRILAGEIGGAIIAFVVLLSCLVVGFSLPELLERWIEKRLQAEGQPDALPAPMLEPAKVNPEAEEASPATHRGSVAAGQKSGKPLPEAFRKSFKTTPAEDEKPAALPQRDERLPPLALLIGDQMMRPDEKYINQTAGLLEKTLADFGVPARVVGFRIGPTVTQFAVEPGYIDKPGQDSTAQKQKVRVAQISALARDLTLALSAERLRIEAPVPGHSYVGIEVPNLRSTLVRLRPILESEAFNKVNSPLSIALGRDVSGQPVVADLARMPHLLIAGTTGSGKSVCIAALTTCLVVNNTPDDLRLIMIDPKMVELVRFNGIPHILGKVETDLERIQAALRWVMGEMDRRYRLLEEMRARDLDSYNHKMQKRKQPPLPRIVVMVDELADLMMTTPDQTEHSLVRLAQMARATGIHLVVATQRPSTDVITGLIKANFPARISFTVASSIDSRVILDTNGAETLLGRGDMLFLAPEVGAPQRSQGVIVTDQEIERIITFWQQSFPPKPETEIPWEELMDQEEDKGDALVERATAIVRREQHASASLLQRRLHIGYPRAASLIDQLEERGVVGPSQGGGRERDVLIGPEEDDEEGDSDTTA
jgi:DNA segregation ATPase FtsK/SpoIIIE, S-DNA-T family